MSYTGTSREGIPVMKKRILMILVAIVALACLVSCSSSSDKTQFGLITWDVDASDNVIEVCGLKKDDYSFTLKSVAALEDPVDQSQGGGKADYDESRRTTFLIAAADELVDQGCKVIAFQFDDSYNQIAMDYMKEHPNLTVYILNRDGTEVLTSQTASSQNEDESIEDDYAEGSYSSDWEVYTSEPYETNDGYKIEKSYAFADRWVDSDDSSAIKSICSELGIDNMISTESINFEYPTVGDGTETPLHCAYLFGYLSAENVTDGWDISEDNPKDLVFGIGMRRNDIDDEHAIRNDTKGTNNSLCYVFYTDKTNTCYLYSGFPAPHYKGKVKIDGYFDEIDGIGLSMKSNDTGKLPFVIVAYSPKNPNNPEGDKWYLNYDMAAYENGQLAFTSCPEDF